MEEFYLGEATVRQRESAGEEEEEEEEEETEGETEGEVYCQFLYGHLSLSVCLSLSPSLLSNPVFNSD